VRRIDPLSFFALSFLLLLTAAPAQQTPAGPPPTRRDDFTETLQGVNVPDPYRWLEDQNSPETRAWIDAQNAYTHSLLDSLGGRDRLQQRETELLRVEAIRPPFERNGRYFFRKRLADQDLYVIYMRQGIQGKDEVLIDPHPMSADHSTNVDMMDVSKDGKVVAYLIRKGGADEDEIHFFDVDTRKDLSDVLPAAVHFDISLTPDRRGVYYSLMTEGGPRIRYHEMGSPLSSDKEVFGKGYTKDKIVVGDVSEDGRHLVIQVLFGSAADKTEIWTQNLSKPGPIEPLITDLDARFFATAGGDRLYLQTNWKAPKGRILAVDFNRPARDNWREIVPESDIAIENSAFVGSKVLVLYVRNASSEVKVFSADGKAEGSISLPTLGGITQVSGRWEGREAFFDFSSYVFPYTVYSYDTASRKPAIWAQVKAPVKSADFEVRQVWFSSKDGTKVPMFLVYRKGLKLDGSNPALMTGYGGFTVNETPGFYANAIIWAEHGGVFADVTLRGGGEFGEAWHRAGMLEKKQNVFDDFIAAAEWLISNHYTQSSRLGIEGGSNGGLLVGAAMTQRPELYRAVVCWHPLLDMLRYQNFMEAQFWVSEYGSSEKADQFKYLYAYSPYHNVKKGTQYPAVLFMTGDADTRVAPLHARKMAALMQYSTGSDRPILLRYELKAGHSAGRSLTATIGDNVDELSFLFWQLGVTP